MPDEVSASSLQARRSIFSADSSLVRYGLPALTLVAAVSVWEVFTRVFRVPTWLLPGPSSVFKVTLEWVGELPFHTWVTFYETALGFALAVAVGLLLGVLIAYSLLLQNTILPLLIVTQAVPKVALAPILLIWIGYGDAPKILVAFLVAFFPVVVNVATGLKAVEPELLDLSRSLSASEWQTFRKVRFPASLPYFFSGTKVAITLALIGAVIGEFVGSDRGLGYLIVYASGHMITSLAFGSIFILAVLGVLLYFAVELAERVLCPWYSE